MPKAASLSRAVNFYGNEFLVSPNTLIPRPETEQLVERILSSAKEHLGSAPRIIDVGTGSGVIAITLKLHLPQATVVAVDNDAAALEIARRNGARLGAKISCYRSNLLDQVASRFDLVIANLPYVPASRWSYLPESVRDFEPRDAIIGGRDGLKWLRPLIGQLSSHLNEPGLVALEIDDIKSFRVIELIRAALPSYQVWVEPDLAGFDRFVFALPAQLT